MARLALVCLLASLAAIAASDRAKRLTTFGKAPENAQTVGPECRTDRDCRSTPQAVCTENRGDHKKRCTCPDGNGPENNLCRHSREKRGYIPLVKRNEKGLREPCTNDTECIVGAECKINPNATSTSHQRTKVCLCEEDKQEVNNTCSGCRGQQAGVILLLGVLALAAIHY